MLHLKRTDSNRSFMRNTWIDLWSLSQFKIDNKFDGFFFLFLVFIVDVFGNILGLLSLNGETNQSNRWMGESSCLRAIELYIVHSDRFSCITKIMMAFSDAIEQISARVQFQTHVLTTPIISKSPINNRSFNSDEWRKEKTTNNT